ncbi:MAG: Beta-lactamase AmpS [Rickettsiaceae bacterium]|jgi:beta-lactamase class D|nr:Beta-lactamase AmpS [Rickettsiaceae bacterium]
MKNFLSAFLLFLSFVSMARAEVIDCFIVKSGENYLIKEGKNCETRYSPASTFKIPLAVIGYESGILKDENHPLWKPQKPITFLQDYWDGEKTPSSWMRYSIVWYSQILTTKLGMKKFQNYVDEMNYGNRDLSGNIGLNDGLTESWLSSSLKISPSEQIVFIEKLAKNKLPFSKESQMRAKNLLRLFEESMWSNGWNIYGKTGSDIDRKTKERRGYFVGFATKNNELISFVIHVSGKEGSKISGIYSKKIAFERVAKIKNLF